MSGPEQLAAQVRLTADYAMPSVSIRRGVVTAASYAQGGYLVTVNVAGGYLTVGPDGMSSVFRAELDANATAGFTAIIGHKVEIHYSAGQPVIAYTVGV